MAKETNNENYSLKTDKIVECRKDRLSGATRYSTEVERKREFITVLLYFQRTIFYVAYFIWSRTATWYIINEVILLFFVVKIHKNVKNKLKLPDLSLRFLSYESRN